MKIESGWIIDLEFDLGKDQQGVYIIDQKPAACQPEFFRDELRLGIHCSQYFSGRRI